MVSVTFYASFLVISYTKADVGFDSGARLRSSVVGVGAEATSA